MSKQFAVIGFALAAVACGGISSKEDAAEAMARVNNASTAAESGAMAGQPLWGEGAGAVVGQTYTVHGETGTATLKLTAQGGEGTGEVTWEITFDNYSADGEDTFDGTITHWAKATGGVTGATAEYGTKGKVSMTGEYSSDLEMDVTMKVQTTVGGGLANVAIVYDGWITADGTKYVYANESISVTAATGG